jgi:aspartokinase-like uncharacterized kinase
MAAQPVSASSTLAATSQDGPIVVKLGGSVIRSPQLAAWLDAIAVARQSIVVVPGGGALADEVRACQAQLGLADQTAHRMALLAMDQLAWAVAGLRQGFAVGATEAELRQALGRRQVAVWAPFALISGRTDIEASWRLTSDSLALWLADRVGARSCYLIKSIAPPKVRRLGARQLARDGIVDEAFPFMLKPGIPTFLLGRGEQSAFSACLAAQAETCGVLID